MKPLTPGARRGAAMWLYCLTGCRRQVVKVGIGGNVPKRVRHLGWTSSAVLREWFQPYNSRKEQVFLVRTWPLGQRTLGEAMAIESECHAAVRERATEYAGEWFRVPTPVAVGAIDEFCARLGCCDGGGHDAIQ